MEAYDQGVLDELAVYGHSLRNSTRKRQSQLHRAIGSSAHDGDDEDDEFNDVDVDDVDSNLDLRKLDISDASTISESSSNFSDA